MWNNLGFTFFLLFAGLGALFGLPFLLGGIGAGIGAHGFKLFEIHHHHHYKEVKKEDQS